MDETNNKQNGNEKRKSFSLRTLILAVFVTVMLTAGVIFGAAWLIIGPEGLSLAETMAIINLRFVGEYDRSKVMDAAAQGMISALGDRWSSYMDADGFAVQKENRDNSYVGIGVTVSYEDERGLLVIYVAADGPADVAGIIPGEIIRAVDGVSITGEDRYQGGELVRGEKGTVVRLEVIGQDGTVRAMQVMRSTVEEPPVSYQLLDGGVGVITIKNFFTRSAEEMEAAVDDLISQGAEALVFDLRNDPGGYLDELTEMLDYLLPEGPIFRSRSRSGRESVITSDRNSIDLPMAVLVNSNSYSAAEFFAAQLRESAGAVVVGTTTCGKGFSQQTYPLLSGGAVSISTRKYLTGKGISLIGTGIIPDPYVELSDDESRLLLQGKLPPEEDPQIQAAVNALF